MPASLKLTDQPAYLKFFQDCSRASFSKPVVLVFPDQKSAQASRAALNAFRAKLREANSDFYQGIKHVVLRIVDNTLVGHPRHMAPLDAALAAAGYNAETNDFDEPAAAAPDPDADWLRDLMEEKS